MFAEEVHEFPRGRAVNVFVNSHVSSSIFLTLKSQITPIFVRSAIASFTKGLARDLGPRSIAVNNLQHGPVDTEMNPADGRLPEATSSTWPCNATGTSIRLLV